MRVTIHVVSSMKYRLLGVLVIVGSSCSEGNVCERQLIFEERECFPELDQPTTVEKDECVDDRKAYAQCATRNEDDYCKYFLWQNRGAARREGYTVSDTLPPANDFVACLDEEGLRER